jgi:hypothetical protein
MGEVLTRLIAAPSRDPISVPSVVLCNPHMMESRSVFILRNPVARLFFAVRRNASRCVANHALLEAKSPVPLQRFHQRRTQRIALNTVEWQNECAGTASLGLSSSSSAAWRTSLTVPDRERTDGSRGGNRTKDDLAALSDLAPWLLLHI